MGKYTTYSFADEIWKTDNEEWVNQRNKEWEQWVQYLVVGMTAEPSKRFLQACERYFKKGEFNPEVKEPLAPSYRVILAPCRSLEDFTRILCSCEDDLEFQNCRGDVLVTLERSRYIPRTGFLFENQEDIANLLVLNTEKYLDQPLEFMGKLSYPFPILIVQNNGLGFYLSWISSILEWLNQTTQVNISLYRFLINHWFTCLPEIDKSLLLDDRFKDKLRELARLVAGHTPISSVVPGGIERNEFVEDFLASINKHGFCHRELHEVWDSVSESDSSAWSEDIFAHEEVTSNEFLGYGPIESFGYFRPFVLRGAKLDSNIFDQVVLCLESRKAIDQTVISYELVNIQNVVTPEFSEELGFSDEEAVQAYRKTFRLTDSYVGTSGVDIFLDLVALIPSAKIVNESRPLFLLLFRPDKHYNTEKALAYNTNQLSLFFTLREKFDLDFVEYFRIDGNPRMESYHPLLKEIKYRIAKTIPFHESPHDVLTIGEFGLLPEDDLVAIETVDAPNFDVINKGV